MKRRSPDIMQREEGVVYPPHMFLLIGFLLLGGCAWTTEEVRRAPSAGENRTPSQKKKHAVASIRSSKQKPLSADIAVPPSPSKPPAIGGSGG